MSSIPRIGNVRPENTVPKHTSVVPRYDPKIIEKTAWKIDCGLADKSLAVASILEVEIEVCHRAIAKYRAGAFLE
jgi:hypothetical protein